MENRGFHRKWSKNTYNVVKAVVNHPQNHQGGINIYKPSLFIWGGLFLLYCNLFVETIHGAIFFHRLCAVQIDRHLRSEDLFRLRKQMEVSAGQIEAVAIQEIY